MNADVNPGRTNFFAVDRAKTNKAFEPDCKDFLAASVPAALNKSLDDIASSAEKYNDKLSSPFILEMAKNILLMAWMLCVLGIFSRRETGQALTDGYGNYPGLYWTAILCFAAWLALFFYLKRRVRRIVEKLRPDSDKLDEQFKRAQNSSKSILGIPEDAPSIDVLCESYTIKNGKRKSRNFALTKYINLPIYAFVSDGKLCLANLEERWDIPLSSFRAVKLVNKRPNMPYWNKPEPCTDEKYKPYKITTNNFGHYFARYCKVDIDDERGLYYLLIPEYDIGTVTELIGIRPEEQ